MLEAAGERGRFPLIGGNQLLRINKCRAVNLRSSPNRLTVSHPAMPVRGLGFGLLFTVSHSFRNGSESPKALFHTQPTSDTVSSHVYTAAMNSRIIEKL